MPVSAQPCQGGVDTIPALEYWRMEPSLDPLFSPESIAVIGASRNPGTIGYQIVDNLVRHGFRGVVYPVNPHARAIHSIPAYPSISAIPGLVDIAVVVVPKEVVLKVVDECGNHGVKAVVVISAGFREVGGEGLGREEVLLEIVRCTECAWWDRTVWGS